MTTVMLDEVRSAPQRGLRFSGLSVDPARLDIAEARGSPRSFLPFRSSEPYKPKDGDVLRKQAGS